MIRRGRPTPLPLLLRPEVSARRIKAATPKPKGNAAAMLARIDAYVGEWDEADTGGTEAMVGLAYMLDRYYGRKERDFFKGED